MASRCLVSAPTLRVALILGCAAQVPLAERAVAPLDDAVSMMQIARDYIPQPPTPAPTLCFDLDSGATDMFGYTCPELQFECGFREAHHRSGQIACCNLGDDSDFTGSLMCCNCQGGGSAPAAAEDASATGDPHVSTVDGARFDLRAGVHEFLRLPRRANQSGGPAEPEPLLSVTAAAERAGEDGCRECYVKQVDVAGHWLNSSGPLRFRAAGDALDDARAIYVWVNGTLVDKEALGHDSRVLPFLKATVRRAHRGNLSSSTMQKVPMFTVELSFASATLKIDWMHRAAPGGPALNHLNFQALGLRRFLDSAGMDIGGILGRDDHGYAASTPEDCKPSAGADLRGRPARVSHEDSHVQIVAAAL